jgi:hypothetical protein
VGAIFDGKKGKRVDDVPAEGSGSKEPQQKHKRGKKGKKLRRGATSSGMRPSLSTQLEGALERPLEAPTCSTTC